MRHVATIATLALMSGTGCVSHVDFNCAVDAPLCDILEVTGDQRRLAPGIDLTRVAWAQGVHTDLMSDGQIAEPVVPLVAGRDAVVRVFVAPQESYEVRGITARFYLWRDGEIAAVAQGDARPITESNMDSLDSTINIRLPGSMVQPGEYEWSVELVEAPAAPRRSGNTDGAVFPAEGGAAIEIEDNGPSLRVHIVPIEWNTDGSGRLPSTSPEALEAFEVAMYRLFPTASVDIEVGPAMAWDQGVGGINGWSVLLDAVTELREARTNIEDDQYIYGLFAPGDGDGGGIAGLSSLAQSPRDANGRASIGISRSPGAGAGTMAHEIGHAQGLRHAPCGGAARPDPDYPHEGASIGSYGYDLYEDQLKGPDTFVDFMSYCGPDWVSDFYFSKMFVRQQGIYELYYGSGEPTSRQNLRTWQVLWMHPDGHVTTGSPRVLDVYPDGSPTRVTLADGTDLDGVFVPFDHIDGGLVFVPTEDSIDRFSLDDGPILRAEPKLPMR